MFLGLARSLKVMIVRSFIRYVFEHFLNLWTKINNEAVKARCVAWGPLRMMLYQVPTEVCWK